MQSTIEIENVCKVVKGVFPVPEKGGVVVLRGTNGTGKSTSLEAIDSLISGRTSDKLSARDGTERGEIRGFDAVIYLGRNTRRRGQAEVVKLDGKFDLSLLIDPGLKDPAAADAKRIKVINQIAGVEADATLFHALIGTPEEFAAVVSQQAIATDDILVMADRIKRDIDKAALGAEGQANTERAHAAACLEAAQGIATDVETNAAKLHDALEAAIRTEQSLKTRQQQHAQHAAKITQVRGQLDAAQANYSGPSAHDARQSLSIAEECANEAAQSVRDAEAALMRVRARQQTANQALTAAQGQLAAAEQHEDSVELLAKTLDEAGEAVSPPEDAELFAAGAAVDNARAAIDAGLMARTAIDKLEKRLTHQAAASIAEKRAIRLRDAAGGVDDVLSAQIAKLGCPLRVEKGRLVTDTERGKSTLFSELSDGERSKIVIDFAADTIGTGGLFILRQVYFEGLSPKNQEALVKHCLERQVVIYTAAVSDDEEIVVDVLN